MISKRNVATIAIMAVAITLGASGLVTSIGQVAYAQSLAEYGIITGFLSSGHHTSSPGHIIKNIQSNSGGSGGGDSGSAAGGK